MLLAIDVGNTHTVAGLFRDRELVQCWRLSSTPLKTSDEYFILFRHMFEAAGYHMDQVRGCIISCVVPPATAVLIQTVETHFSIQPLLVGPGIRTGVPLHVDLPHEVGADRIVNAIAAFRIFGGPAIVVDFGTATTFDPISEQGAFLGGAIAPGLNISAEALYSHASKLPRVEIVCPPRVIGKNTIENIQSGLYFGYLGLIDGILERMCAELGGDPMVVSTGGLGGLFVRDSTWIRLYEPDLTLKGLQMVYEMNRKS